MTSPTAKLTVLIASLVVPALSARAEEAPAIGPTRIPFYTGNLSVAPFMNYWGTRQGPPDDGVTPERLAILKRIGCFADCDYQSWALAEPEPGRWDFSLYRRNADALRAAGFEYIPFCWLHFPPKWFLETPDFVPYRCAEHDEPLMQLSPWAPKIWEIYRRFYSAQRQAMGDRIGWIRVATPSDYGEIGYPAAMTSWLVPQKHAHPGYWCGDSYARDDFRAEMRRRFRSLDALNRRWGTTFASWEDVTYPDLVDERGARQARESRRATDRRRWLDFVEWYNGVWLRFVPKLVALLRELYPTNRMIVSVGYASELTCFGNDYSAIPRMARRIGIALQTPGNVAYYALKRVSTACHFYGTPYYTEPPGDVPPPAEIARVFADASNGVQVYFEYPQNLDRARAQLARYKDHLTGARPVVDLALFHPSVEHRLEGGAHHFPLNVFLVGEQGRHRYDFDVVDEQLVMDGALSRYRVLVYVQGNVTEALALRRIAAWVRSGGTLLTCDLGPVESVEGDRSLWSALVPKRLPALAEVYSEGRFRWSAVARLCTRRVGRGLVIQVPVAPSQHPLLIEAVQRAAYHLSDFGPTRRNAPLITDGADPVRATLFPDRILYHNPTDREVVKRLTFRPEDWAGRRRRPATMSCELHLAPHSIEAVPLR